MKNNTSTDAYLALQEKIVEVQRSIRRTAEGQTRSFISRVLPLFE